MKQPGSHIQSSLLLLVLFHSLATVSWADLVGDSSNGPVDDDKARESLADKLQRLSQSLDMKEGSYEDSRGSGKDYNGNDRNSFLSTTTYHSYVWDYCLRFAGGGNCERWLDPYVSSHGAHADRSPLEGVVYDEWNKRKPENLTQDPPSQGGVTQYAIWDIKRDPQAQGSLITVDGRLNREGIIDMRLSADVRRKVEKVGIDTAQRTINQSYDAKGGNDPGTMPNMEALRMMAGRWTKMMRNRLVANLGEARASDVPVEVGLGEDNPDCASYAAGVQADADPEDEKLRSQALLDPETRGKRLEERMALCEKLRAAPVYAVNPELDANGENVVEGDRDREAVDRWRARVNIALIDSVGKNPNSIPRPGNAPLERYEYENDIPDWAAGGRQRVSRRMTNADQLAGYNRNLADAAVGMQEVAMRSGYQDQSAKVLAYQIAPETRNMVELNGLTEEMRGELKGTAFAKTSSGAVEVARRPEKRLEMSPSELTVRRTQ